MLQMRCSKSTLTTNPTLCRIKTKSKVKANFFPVHAMQAQGEICFCVDILSSEECFEYNSHAEIGDVGDIKYQLFGG